MVAAQTIRNAKRGRNRDATPHSCHFSHCEISPHVRLQNVCFYLFRSNLYNPSATGDWGWDDIFEGVM